MTAAEQLSKLQQHRDEQDGNGHHHGDWNMTENTDSMTDDKEVEPIENNGEEAGGVEEEAAANGDPGQKEGEEDHYLTGEWG